jgi:hypothetical protein
MKHKKGDKVTVRKDLILYGDYEGRCFIDCMMEKAGRIVTIKEVYNDYYKILEDNFSWTDEMFEDKPEIKVGQKWKNKHTGLIWEVDMIRPNTLSGEMILMTHLHVNGVILSSGRSVQELRNNYILIEDNIDNDAITKEERYIYKGHSFDTMEQAKVQRRKDRLCNLFKGQLILDGFIDEIAGDSSIARQVIEILQD